MSSSSSSAYNSDQLDSTHEENVAAQWVDEDDLGELIDSEEDEFAEDRQKEAGSMKRDLASLSFGTLAKASQIVQQDDTESGSDSNFDRNENSEPEHTNEASSSKPRSNPHKKVKRIDKHAPMEISSKKAVSRRRTVVDVPKIEFRDPRFSTLSGEVDPQKFARSYGFITDIQQTELSELIKSLKRARILLKSSPAHLREERTAEVTRLEHATKRIESSVARAKRESRQREALTAAHHDEREKQKDGKGTWFMKKSEKEKVIARARFEDFAKEGKGAVRKAIAKRQLKLSQKEKRSRPDGHGRGGPLGGGSVSSPFSEHPQKRQRVQ